MKNIIKNTLIIGASVAMLATGCIKESIQSSTVNKEVIANSASGTAAMMNGIPGFVNTINLFGRSNPYGYDWGYPSIGMIRDFLCNDMAAASGSYEWFTAWFTNQAMGDSYVYAQFIWNYYTQFLYTANDLIGVLGKAEDAADEVRHYAGIAYAFRAMIWLDMARMYEFKSNTVYDMPELEGQTIPLINESLTEEIAVNNPRLPKEEIISYIKEDIDTALELLEGFVSEDRSLPTKAFVYGLLARTLLWEGDYDNAKIAAQDALNAGSFTPLTEAQWTDPKTGFNSVETQSSWILCSRLTSDSSAVKLGSGLFNFTSWMASETTFGYISLDCLRCCDAKFYSQIPDTDWRKKSWKAPAGSTLEVPMNPAKGAYPGPSVLNDLANVKFRPGNGEPNDPLVAAACDYPLMRMEEMKFIIAECDARNGSAASLIDIVKTRNPQYTTSLTGDSLVREVLFQKRIEFWGEGIIYFDYKRCPEYLNIERGYPGTNHQADARFNVKGLAPWFNFCIVKTETMSNTAIVNNPDPSDKVALWSEN